jgi:hypothetical protein
MTCDQMVLDKARIDQISGVDTCPSDIGQECYTLSVGGFVTVTIKAVIDGQSLSPSEVRSISAVWYVVVT